MKAYFKPLFSVLAIIIAIVAVAKVTNNDGVYLAGEFAPKEHAIKVLSNTLNTVEFANVAEGYSYMVNTTDVKGCENYKMWMSISKNVDNHVGRGVVNKITRDLLKNCSALG